MTGEETSHVGKNDRLEWRDISPMKELMCCDIAPDEIKLTRNGEKGSSQKQALCRISKENLIQKVNPESLYCF